MKSPCYTLLSRCCCMLQPMQNNFSDNQTHSGLSNDLCIYSFAFFTTSSSISPNCDAENKEVFLSIFLPRSQFQKYQSIIMIDHFFLFLSGISSNNNKYFIFLKICIIQLLLFLFKSISKKTELALFLLTVYYQLNLLLLSYWF